MKNIYDNPVGSIKKDIYIVRNKINDKVYIGQSINVKIRFEKHCKDIKSLLGKAIQEYGKRNFFYEILEKQVENYNEREKYWIKMYQSQTPYGYNILEGGLEPPRYFGTNHPNSNITIEKLENIKHDLKETILSLNTIADKYNISKRTIIRINSGISYQDIEETYPIRKNPNITGKLTEKNVNEIIELLRFTYRSYEDISKQYNVEYHAISKICQGISHKKNNIDYPIRNYKNSGIEIFTYEQVTEIIYLLQNTSLSHRKIAKRYNVAKNVIIGINNGTTKRYKRKEYIYPLRKR